MSHNPDLTPSGGSDPARAGGDPTSPLPGYHPPPAPIPQEHGGPEPSTWAQQPAPPFPSGPRPQPPVKDEERTFAVLAHISPIIAAVLSVGWLTILGPLVIWAFYKDRSPLVRQAAAGAFNFNLVIWAAIIVGWVCLFTVILIPLALLLWLAAGIVGLVCHIQGAVKASRGESYRYPFSITVLS